MGVDDLRAEIDAIDGELLALLRRRFEVSTRIGEAKRLAGMPVYSPDRERQIIERVEPGYLRIAYAGIVEACRNRSVDAGRAAALPRPDDGGDPGAPLERADGR